MSQSFKVKVNETFDFDFSKTDITSLDVVKNENQEFHVLHHNKSHSAKVLSSNFEEKQYTIEVNGTEYTVDIANQLDQLIKSLGFSVGSGKQINAIKAPMPGLILEINIEVGQTVSENDQLLILEAMKMENSIVSPRDGVIKSIAVTQGEAIEKMQLLIEFE
ncbi:MAG: acetyl-CoA carboxylase biotin carboxyl carrier protein subunit [Bacteroidetes bacterium MedPE-SWsnd-G2]|nr:MAG: acetyl-CoA carboxylase biotin carboxyl carrier protein subunit [Bacteroidetes bacterium MedPE-SWsnd-G2]